MKERFDSIKDIICEIIGRDDVGDVAMIVLSNPDRTSMVVLPQTSALFDGKGVIVIKRAKIEITPLPDEKSGELWSYTIPNSEGEAK